MNNRQKSRREESRIMQTLERNQIIKKAAKISYSREAAEEALKQSEENKKVDPNHTVLSNLK